MIKLKETDDIWFTSDPHVSHNNMCRGVSVWQNLESTRDFPTVHEMNKMITVNINKCATKTSHLFLLGDLMFGDKHYDRFFDLIDCDNIYVIYGNHDNINLLKECKHPKLKFQGHYEKLMVGKKEIILSHYPIFSWENSQRGSWMLFGHCHNTLKDLTYLKRRCFDVGIDWAEFRPYNYFEIKEIMRLKEILVVDHHDPNDNGHTN